MHDRADEVAEESEEDAVRRHNKELTLEDYQEHQREDGGPVLERYTSNNPPEVSAGPSRLCRTSRYVAYRR